MTSADLLDTPGTDLMLDVLDAVAVAEQDVVINCVPIQYMTERTTEGCDGVEWFRGEA